MSEFCEIQQLAKLFNLPKDDDESSSDVEPDESSKGANKIRPVLKATKASPYAKLDQSLRQEVVEVVDFDKEDLQSEFATNWKQTPKWDLSYRQKITASDVFLQMGAKTPLTASCEDIIITVELPGEKMPNIEIKVLRTEFKLISPRFYLQLPLPQPVDPQKGNATWNSEHDKLIVTLRMDREFDVVNF